MKVSGRKSGPRLTDPRQPSSAHVFRPSVTAGLGHLRYYSSTRTPLRMIDLWNVECYTTALLIRRGYHNVHSNSWITRLEKIEKLTHHRLPIPGLHRRLEECLILPVSCQSECSSESPSSTSRLSRASSVHADAFS